MDETYADLCARLNRSLRRRSSSVKCDTTPFEDATGGKIRNENDKFCLYPWDGSHLEIDLGAEVPQKLATLIFTEERKLDLQHDLVLGRTGSQPES